MITFPAASDFSQPIAAKDRQRAAISLTGASALTLRLYNEPRENAAVVLTMTTSSSPSSLTITSASGGLFTATFDGASTTALEGTYVAEITVTLSSGEQVLLGTFTVVITRSHALGT